MCFDTATGFQCSFGDGLEFQSMPSVGAAERGTSHVVSEEDEDADDEEEDEDYAPGLERDSSGGLATLDEGGEENESAGESDSDEADGAQSEGDVAGSEVSEDAILASVSGSPVLKRPQRQSSLRGAAAAAASSSTSALNQWHQEAASLVGVKKRHAAQGQLRSARSGSTSVDRRTKSKPDHDKAMGKKQSMKKYNDVSYVWNKADIAKARHLQKNKVKKGGKAKNKGAWDRTIFTGQSWVRDGPGRGVLRRLSAHDEANLHRTEHGDGIADEEETSLPPTPPTGVTRVLYHLAPMKKKEDENLIFKDTMHHMCANLVKLRREHNKKLWVDVEHIEAGKLVNRVKKILKFVADGYIPKYDYYFNGYHGANQDQKDPILVELPPAQRMHPDQAVIFSTRKRFAAPEYYGASKSLTGSQLEEFATLLPQLLNDGGHLVCDSCNSGYCVKAWDLIPEDYEVMTDHTPYRRQCCFAHKVEDCIRGTKYVQAKSKEQIEREKRLAIDNEKAAAAAVSDVPPPSHSLRRTASNRETPVMLRQTSRGRGEKRGRLYNPYAKDASASAARSSGASSSNDNGVGEETSASAGAAKPAKKMTHDNTRATKFYYDEKPQVIKRHAKQAFRQPGYKPPQKEVVPIVNQPEKIASHIFIDSAKKEVSGPDLLIYPHGIEFTSRAGKSYGRMDKAEVGVERDATEIEQDSKVNFGWNTASDYEFSSTSEDESESESEDEKKKKRRQGKAPASEDGSGSDESGSDEEGGPPGMPAGLNPEVLKQVLAQMRGSGAFGGAMGAMGGAPGEDEEGEEGGEEEDGEEGEEGEEDPEAEEHARNVYNSVSGNEEDAQKDMKSLIGVMLSNFLRENPGIMDEKSDEETSDYEQNGSGSENEDDGEEGDGEEEEDDGDGSESDGSTHSMYD